MPTIDAKRICLVRPSAIGDTVHALALVNGLRKGFPDAHITWVVEPISFEIFRYQPSVDLFITYSRKGSLRQWLNLARRLRKENYDLAVIPQASGKTSLITAIMRADVKLGFDWARGRDLHWLVTNRHVPPRPVRHVQDQFLEFLDYLEISNYKAEWNFSFTEEEMKWHQEVLAEREAPAVGFVIATARHQKNWPPERYAPVIDHIARKHRLSPVIIGGPDPFERKIAEQIISRCRCRPENTLGLPMRKTMLYLAGCRLVVAPDTGTLHIAVAMNTPVVGLYGHTDPRRCGPYKKFHDLLIDKYNDPGEENAPVTRKTKTGRMKCITVEEVIEKIELGLSKYNDKTRNISVI